MEYYAPVQGGVSSFAGVEISIGAGIGAAVTSPSPSRLPPHLQHADSSLTQETTLEESLWQLTLQPQEGMEPAQVQYPERPGEPDCPYYMRTGLCSFGMSCHFNHPPNWKLAAFARTKGDYPERAGQPECQYYLKTGTCKFGATCKYHHPRDKAGSTGRVQLNALGLPLRLGEKECAYYMRTGNCKYGVTCKFHHPQLLGTLLPTPISPIYTAGSPSAAGPQAFPAGLPSWPVARPPYMASPRVAPSGYAPMILPPPQGIMSMPGWNTYQGPLSPMAGPEGHPQLGGFIMQADISGLQGTYPSFLAGSAAMGLPALQPPTIGIQKDTSFPERPGQPECQYYMKTGDCKFGATCRYHHPKDRAPPSATCVLSPMGLPLRPGSQPCTYYSRHGICKFGPTCKFDHPLGGLSYSPSASSLADMPVAPYPIGSSPTTLAPSSASTDVRDTAHSADPSKDILASSEPLPNGQLPAKGSEGSDSSIAVPNMLLSGSSQPKQVSASMPSEPEGSGSANPVNNFRTSSQST